MGNDQRSALRELRARRSIEELLTRRGRAADAKDPDAILAEHVPGSRDTHGIFDGTIEDFVDYLRTHNYQDGALREATPHRLQRPYPLRLTGRRPS